MNIFDYLIGITIGSIGADIALDVEKGIGAGVVSLLIFGLSGVLVTYLTIKSVRLRRMLIGVPSILIEKGQIIEKSLRKEGIDINDLQEEARQCGYFDLSKVDYAVLETSGNISFLAKDDYEVIVRKDMGIKVKGGGLCANIIIDGVLLENNLVYINKTKEWLDKELKKKGYGDYSKILLLTVDGRGSIVVYDKNDDSSLKVLE